MLLLCFVMIGGPLARTEAVENLYWRGKRQPYYLGRVIIVVKCQTIAPGHYCLAQELTCMLAE